MRKYLSVFSLGFLLCFIFACTPGKEDAGASKGPDREIGTVTTSSQEAFELYEQGREIFAKNQMKESIPLFEQAISLDPEFSMAYRSLASAYRNIGGRDNLVKANDYLKKALELGEKASPKEKMIIQGDVYANIDNDYEKAIEIFAELNKKYPENLVTWSTWLGWLHAQLNDWDEVIKYSEIVRKNKGSLVSDYERLGNAYAAKGMYAEARSVYQDYVDNFSELPSMLGNISFTYMLERDYEKAIEAVDKAIALQPRNFSRAPIYHLQGDFEAAEREYKSWQDIDTAGAKINSRRWLEFLYRMLGQYGKAEEVAREALKIAEENNLIGWKRILFNMLAEYDLAGGNLDNVLEKATFIWDSSEEFDYPPGQIGALWWRIRVSLGRDDLDQALALAEEVKQIADKTPTKIDIRWYFDDLGLIEMKRGNYPKAIEYFTQVYDMQGGQRGWFDPHAYILSNLASAYFLNGDLNGAKKAYENILTLTTGRFQAGDLYPKAFYQLGKIHEEQGNISGALEHYEKFLELWKNADPGLPEVGDARKRLAGLKGSG